MGKSRKNHGKTPAPKAPNQLSGHSRVAAWEETSRDRRSSRVASPGGGTPWDAMGKWIQGGLNGLMKGEKNTYIYIYHHVYIIHIYGHYIYMVRMLWWVSYMGLLVKLKFSCSERDWLPVWFRMIFPFVFPTKGKLMILGCTSFSDTPKYWYHWNGQNDVDGRMWI